MSPAGRASNSPSPAQTLRRIAVRRSEAAELLSVSVDFFEQHIQPELPIIRRGRVRLFRVLDLEQWATQNAALTLERESWS